MPAAAVRIALVLLAAAGLAVAAVWLRDTSRLDRGTALGAAPGAAPAQREEAIRLLRSARTLSADNTALLVIASQEALLGRRQDAVRTLRTVLHDEPENSVVWSALAIVEAKADPRVAAQARRRAAELNPFGSG